MLRIAAGERFFRSVRRVLRTHYPAFIFGFPLQHAEVPVFVYHDVKQDDFAADLDFFQENGYEPLGIDEYVQSRQHADSRKAVLLTFDDARRSFWEVAFPLLKEYQAHATLFVPVAWMAGAQPDAWSGLHGREQFMTWDELRACAQSGNVDVQSHGYRHGLVYQTDHLVDFASPALLRSQDIYDWPMRLGAGTQKLGRPPLGTPIYEAAPLLSAGGCVIDDPDLEKACQQEAASQADFFDHPSWRSRLEQVYHSQRTGNLAVKRMDPDEYVKLVETEFQCSSQVFERELGYRPAYFAYPWMLGSDLSLRMASYAGIRAVFGVGLDFGRIRRLKSPVPAYSRIKCDWARFLPGKGRLSLGQVVPEKARSFLGAQHLAH
jgi:peptidoglycan/xylan/chitin deacetylase (PgdA/CDA1 family)